MAADMTLFTRSVLDAVDQIPAGRVIAYGDVAELADRPGAPARSAP